LTRRLQLLNWSSQTSFGLESKAPGSAGGYLLLTPDYTGDVPPGYIPLRPKTYNSYALIRSIVASRSEEDVRAGDALVKQIKVYPLSKEGNPPEPRLVDMTDKLYNAIVPYDDGFYVSLARVIDEEPAQSRDLQMLGMLLPLGIEKGKEFKPDPATRTQLKAAAAEAQAWLIEGIISTSERRPTPCDEWTQLSQRGSTGCAGAASIRSWWSRSALLGYSMVLK
jgi:hypothetical protein